VCLGPAGPESKDRTIRQRRTVDGDQKGEAQVEAQHQQKLLGEFIYLSLSECVSLCGWMGNGGRGHRSHQRLVDGGFASVRPNKKPYRRMRNTKCLMDLNIDFHVKNRLIYL
jgi:hypothetical protein